MGDVKPPLLELQNVYMSYQEAGEKRAVLRGVNLSLRAGAIVGLLGESGSGKTSLARVITGQQEPQEGIVRLAGQTQGPIRRRSFREAAAIQYIFQDPYGVFDARSSIGEVLQEPQRLCRRYGYRDVLPSVEAMQLVGLAAYSNDLRKQVGELSGGQRQRLAVARALIPRPQLLIADESTCMLDATSADEILELYKELNRDQGLTILLITHQLRVVSACCKYVLVMKDGLVTEEGRVADFLERPRTAYGRQLMESMRYFDQAIQR